MLPMPRRQGFRARQLSFHEHLRSEKSFGDSGKKGVHPLSSLRIYRRSAIRKDRFRQQAIRWTSELTVRDIWSFRPMRVSDTQGTDHSRSMVTVGSRHWMDSLYWAKRGRFRSPRMRGKSPSHSTERSAVPRRCSVSSVWFVLRIRTHCRVSAAAS